MLVSAEEWQRLEELESALSRAAAFGVEVGVEHFYAKAGEVIALPEKKIDRPQRDFLEWHLEEVFKAS